MYKDIIKNNKELINMNDRHYITYPKNCYDMNYHLVDLEEEMEYLIDIGDVIRDHPDDGLVQWEDIKNLTNIEELKTYSWKKQELKYNPYIIQLIKL